MATTRLVELILKGKDETKAAFASAEKSFAGITLKQAAWIAGSIAAAAAVAKMASKLYDFVAAQAAVGDAFDDMSQRTGIAVEALSEYDFIVKRGGGTTSDMEQGVRRLSRAMADATEGVKESVDAFTALGISTSDLVGTGGDLKSIDDVLPRIARGLEGVSSQAERMDIAQAIFGRGGTMLLPALQDGEEGLRRMRQELERYGGAMSVSFATKASAFADAHVNLANAAQRLKEAVSEPFLVPFTNAVNTLAAAISATQGVRFSGAMIPGALGAGLLGALSFGGGGGGQSVRSSDDWFSRGMSAWQMPGGSTFSPHIAGMEGPISQPFMPAGGTDISGRPLMSMVPDPEMVVVWEDVNDQSAEFVSKLGELTITLEDSATAAEMFGMNLSTSLGYAFADAITGARSFGDSLVSILQNAFADILGNLAGNLFASAVGLTPIGLTAGLFQKSATPASKSMPGPISMSGYGRFGAAADLAYGKAFI